MPQAYADMQIALQTIRELLYEKNEEKLNFILDEFKDRSESGVRAGIELFNQGFFTKQKPSAYSVQDIFDLLDKIMI